MGQMGIVTSSSDCAIRAKQGRDLFDTAGKFKHPFAQGGVLYESAITELPEGERTAFLMRTQCGLSYEEIARALGIGLSAAKVRVHRSRIKLAKQLSKAGG